MSGIGDLGADYQWFAHLPTDEELCTLPKASIIGWGVHFERAPYGIVANHATVPLWLAVLPASAAAFTIDYLIFGWQIPTALKVLLVLTATFGGFGAVLIVIVINRQFQRLSPFVIVNLDEECVTIPAVRCTFPFSQLEQFIEVQGWVRGSNADSGLSWVIDLSALLRWEAGFARMPIVRLTKKVSAHRASRVLSELTGTRVRRVMIVRSEYNPALLRWLWRRGDERPGKGDTAH